MTDFSSTNYFYYCTKNVLKSINPNFICIFGHSDSNRPQIFLVLMYSYLKTRTLEYNGLPLEGNVCNFWWNQLDVPSYNSKVRIWKLYCLSVHIMILMNPFDRSALSADNEDIKVRYWSGAASFCASATISVLLSYCHCYTCTTYSTWYVSGNLLLH